MCESCRAAFQLLVTRGYPYVSIGAAISLDASSTYFDVGGDLFRERTGRLKGDDGFLVLDANGNVWVDEISEMFGNRFQGGYDGNGDGKISMADVVWARLRIWQDKNRDGVAGRSEKAGRLVASNDNLRARDAREAA